MITDLCYGDPAMQDIKKAVRERYGKIGAAGKEADSCCAPSCCSPDSAPKATCSEQASLAIGYSEQELSTLPEGTVPLPLMLKTSSTGIRNGRSLGRAGTGM